MPQADLINGVPKDKDKSPSQDDRKTKLVNWVMLRVDRWREHRDSNYLDKWSEYYRLWRGFFADKDKNKEAERSKLIAPALQQAVDMTVSEMEEATFGREVWFDISDDYQDKEKEDAIVSRDQLLCDFEENEVPSAVSETFLNGALYGTGIGKIMIGRSQAFITEKDEDGTITATSEKRFRVWLEPVAPQNFIIDPGARNVDEALGCAHEIAVPMHGIKSKQRKGQYYKGELGSWDGTGSGFDETGKLLIKDTDRSEMVLITEYHGLVPKNLITGDDKDSEDDLVEAIVTIANKSLLLRDVENPYLFGDRAVISYQHETVPGRFWGRGVSEKGYNPQKALDAELRARIDSLAYLTYPILGADATRLPRGFDPRVRPGRTFLTNGRPSEILEPIVFGNLNPATFQQSGDLERMVQMGTGAMDSASPTESNRRNETAGGMSMIQGGFIKRSKRTMQNVERQFLDKLVQKSLWRYMQFDEKRYPQDYEFQVNATMGIMAREFEQGTLVQMLQVIPPESPLFPILIKGIVTNSAASNKNELTQAVDAMLKPDPKAQQMQEQMHQLQMAQLQAEVEKLQAQAQLAQAQGQQALSNAQLAAVKAELEDDKVEILAANTMIDVKDQEVNQINAHAAIMKAHAEHKKADAQMKSASQPKSTSK